MNGARNNPPIFASDDRPVFRIIVYCLSLAFSVLVASLETVRHGDAGFAFHISWRTLFVLLVSASFFVVCFKAIFHSTRRKLRRAALAVVSMIGLGAFLYPLRFVPLEKFGDIFFGLAIAASLVSAIAAALYGVNRFLNADAEAMDAGASRKL